MQATYKKLHAESLNDLSQIVTAISNKTSISRNDIFRQLSGDPNESEQFITSTLYFISSITRCDEMVKVSNSYSELSTVGYCYNNAYNEYKRTGNKPYIGYEYVKQGTIVTFTCHAFNRDKDTGEFYDTEDPHLRPAGRKNRLACILVEPDAFLAAVKKDGSINNLIKGLPNFVATTVNGTTHFLKYNLEDKRGNSTPLTYMFDDTTVREDIKRLKDSYSKKNQLAVITAFNCLMMTHHMTSGR
jgi:hypothetical protein